MYDDLVLPQRSIKSIVATALVFSGLAGACFVLFHHAPQLSRELMWLPITVGAIGFALVTSKLANRTRWTFSKRWINRFDYWNKQTMHVEAQSFDHVQINKVEVATNNKGKHYEFHVNMTGGPEPLLIWRLKDYFQARSMAEQISRTTELDLVDESEDPAQRRNYRDLDLNLVRLLKRDQKGNRVKGIVPPRLTIDEGGQMQIFLPRNFICPHLFTAAIPWGLYTFVGFQFDRLDIGLSIVIGWVLIALFAIRQQRISIRDNNLIIANVTGIPFWWRSIPLGELEELFVSEEQSKFQRAARQLSVMIPKEALEQAPTFEANFGTYGIVGRSDRKVIKTGRYLFQYEAEYLMQKLEYWIVRQRPATGKMDAYSRRVV